MINTIGFGPGVRSTEITARLRCLHNILFPRLSPYRPEETPRRALEQKLDKAWHMYSRWRARRLLLLAASPTVRLSALLCPERLPRRSLHWLVGEFSFVTNTSAFDMPTKAKGALRSVPSERLLHYAITPDLGLHTPGVERRPCVASGIHTTTSVPSHARAVHMMWHRTEV